MSSSSSSISMSSAVPAAAGGESCHPPPPPPPRATSNINTGMNNRHTQGCCCSSSSSFSSSSELLSLPPSVTGPLYGILSLDLCEIIKDDDDEQVNRQESSTAITNDDTSASPTKFRVVWWGDTNTINKDNANTVQQQQLLTPGNIATPFDKCKISYNIRCTPPKFLKYLNDARSVSLRGVGSTELALQVCKLPLQPAVAEARSGGTMTIRIDGCFPIVNTHSESKRMGQKLKLKLSVEWKTNTPNQFTTTTGVKYSHYPLKSPPPAGGGGGMGTSVTTGRPIPQPPPPPMVVPPPPPHSGTSALTPSNNTSEAITSSSSATPSYGNFIDNNYWDNNTTTQQHHHHHLHPPPPATTTGPYSRPPNNHPPPPPSASAAGYRVYPPPPVMELPAPSPTYFIGQPPQQQQLASPSVNSSRWHNQQQFYDGASGSILFRQNSGASLVPDPSRIDPSPPQSKGLLPPPPSSTTTAAAAATAGSKASAAAPTATIENKGDDGDLKRYEGREGISNALQLAAVYSEPFGFLPSSTKPSDRQWAELLATDPMFESPHHKEEIRSTTPIREEEDKGRKRRGNIDTSKPNLLGNRPPPKRGTPTSEGHKRRIRKRSLDKSAKKSTSNNNNNKRVIGGATSSQHPLKSTAAPPPPTPHRGHHDTRINTISNDNLWVFMAIQSITPTDGGGGPLPNDLVVRLRASKTVTQELYNPPLDGYGYYGEEELGDLAMVSNNIITQDNDDEEEEDYGTTYRSPRVQAAIELWQGENQLYGVGRIALDLAPRDISALSNGALVRMEALVDCVSGWSGAILATCQLLVDVSAHSLPLENALQMRLKHHILNDNKEDTNKRKKKTSNHLDSNGNSYIENGIMEERASPMKLNETLAVLKMNLRKSNEALLEELSEGASPSDYVEELISPQGPRAVPIAVTDSSTNTPAAAAAAAAADDDIGGGKALLTSVGTSPIILPNNNNEEEESQAAAVSPTASTTRQDDSIMSCRWIINESIKGNTLHQRQEGNIEQPRGLDKLLLYNNKNEQGGGTCSTHADGHTIPTCSSHVSGLVGISREEQQEYVNMHLPYNSIIPTTTPTSMIDHGVSTTTDDNEYISNDNDAIPYADTQTLLRALTLMDEKVKYLTNRDHNTSTSSSEAAEITMTVPLEPVITETKVVNQCQAAPNVGSHDLRSEDHMVQPEQENKGKICDGGIEEVTPNTMREDETNLAIIDNIEKDNGGIEGDDDNDNVNTSISRNEEECNKGKEEESSTLKRIEELARRVVELETSKRSLTIPPPVVASGSEVNEGIVDASIGNEEDNVSRSSNEDLGQGELEDNVMGHIKETRETSDCAINHIQREEEGSIDVDVIVSSYKGKVFAVADDNAATLAPSPLMVDESISNPNSSLQEQSSQGKTSPPAVEIAESSGSSWLEEEPARMSIGDTSLSPEIILEPSVRSPREVTETRKSRLVEKGTLDRGVDRRHDIVAISTTRHPTPVVDVEAIRQISSLNDRIAHLEVTAEEVVAKYKQAEARLLYNHHYQVNTARHLGERQTFNSLPSESWIPFSDPPPHGRLGPSNIWLNNCKGVDGVNISKCVQDRHHHYHGEDETGYYGKQNPPTSREVVSIPERDYQPYNKQQQQPPASVRLEMKRALVRDAKRVAAILKGRDRFSVINDDDDDDDDDSD